MRLTAIGTSDEVDPMKICPYGLIWTLAWLAHGCPAAMDMRCSDSVRKFASVGRGLNMRIHSL